MQEEELVIDADSVRAARHRRRGLQDQNVDGMTINPQDVQRAALNLVARLGGRPLVINSDDVEAARQRRARTPDLQPPEPASDALPICPWCGSPVRPQGDPLGPSRVCDADGEVQHSRCWDEGGGCARVGCPNQPRL